MVYVPKKEVWLVKRLIDLRLTNRILSQECTWGVQLPTQGVLTGVTPTVSDPSSLIPWV